MTPEQRSELEDLLIEITYYAEGLGGHWKGTEGSLESSEEALFKYVEALMFSAYEEGREDERHFHS